MSELRRYQSNVPRHLVAVACAYEAFAIVTRKVPTISAICWRRRVLVPVVLVGIAVHLLRPPK